MMHKYGLIGFPLSHSFSRDFFNQKFNQLQLKAAYELYPLESIDSLPLLIDRETQLLGLNVTIPYKKEVIRFLDELSPEVEAIGAVNTIAIHRNGQSFFLKGCNTDAAAFGLELDDFAEGITGNALILGTGGAAAAAAYVLKSRGWSYQMISRNENQNGIGNILSYKSLSKQIIEESRLIVNASPVGLFPDLNSAPVLPYEWLNKSHHLFDMIYNPPLTKFLSMGKERGCKTRNGLGMLHKQAELAWEIWQTAANHEK